MKNFVVWIDSEFSHIYEFENSQMKKSVLRKADRSYPQLNKHIAVKNENTEHYYRDLEFRVKDADHLLLIGPGEAKTQFKEHVLAHPKKALAKKKIQIEAFQSIKHKSEKQMLLRAQKFFEPGELLAAQS